MNTDLNAILPTSHPYGAIHSGTESVNSIPNADIVDWVLLEIHHPLNTVIARRAAFLKKDGNIVDLDGTSPVLFESVPHLEYHVSVLHRNHLGVVTEAMIIFTGGL